MTIRAYPEIYLDGAMSRTGELFDFCVNDCRLSGDDFVNQFVYSEVCRRLERGDFAYIAGKSGVEIAIELLGDHLPAPKKTFHRTQAHWCGYVSCYYQWRTNRRYADLFQAVPYREMSRLYHALHEADLSKTAEIFDRQVKKHFPDTKLKRQRLAYGCSQAELARRSGVSLRSIQMYEQRNKDVNKAHAETLLRLSKTLGCQMEDLIEPA